MFMKCTQMFMYDKRKFNLVISVNLFQLSAFSNFILFQSYSIFPSFISQIQKMKKHVTFHSFHSTRGEYVTGTLF